LSSTTNCAAIDLGFDLSRMPRSQARKADDHHCHVAGSGAAVTLATLTLSTTNPLRCATSLKVQGQIVQRWVIGRKNGGVVEPCLIRLTGSRNTIEIEVTFSKANSEASKGLFVLWERTGRNPEVRLYGSDLLSDEALQIRKAVARQAADKPEGSARISSDAQWAKSVV
jgi:hypothetical protein